MYVGESERNVRAGKNLFMNYCVARYGDNITKNGEINLKASGQDGPKVH